MRSRTVLMAMLVASVIGIVGTSIAVGQVAKEIYKESIRNFISFGTGIVVNDVGKLAYGKAEKTGESSFAFFGAAFGFGSADMFGRVGLKTMPIPEIPQGQLDRIEVLEVRVTGQIRVADLDAVVCGASWVTNMGVVHLDGRKIGDRADFPIPSVGCGLPNPKAKVLELIDKIELAVQAGQTLLKALGLAGISFNPWQKFEMRIPLFDLHASQFQLLNRPLELSVDVGRRVGAVLGAIATTVGEIKIEAIEIIGWTSIGPIVYLSIWHSYSDEGQGAEQLIEVKSYNIRAKQLFNIGDYPEERITCPAPYPSVPTQSIRGKLYAIIADRLWRLDYLEQDNDISTRVSVTGDRCNYGPIRMDRSHKLVINFQRAVSDLMIAGFRAEPSAQVLQQSQEFRLFLLVRNAGELSALEASRTVPLSGNFSIKVQVNNQPGETSVLGGLSCAHLPCTGFVDTSLQPGQAKEVELFTSGRWVAPQAPAMIIQATVDAKDEVDEGIRAEQNNTAAFTVFLAAPALPDPAFKDPKADVGFTQVGPTTLRLRADVSNLSPTTAAADVIVRFIIEESPPVGFQVIGEQTIRSLRANSTQRVEVNWDVCKIPVGRHIVGVLIDPDNRLQELNERNNSTGLEVMVLASASLAKLMTDKPGYQLDEMVTITFSNGCAQTISLRNSAPWVIKDSQSRVVFTPTALPVITTVRAGESKNWQWDQKDNNRRPVPAGTYAVDLQTMDAGTYAASFEIKGVDKARLNVNAVGQVRQGPIVISAGLNIQVQVNGNSMTTPISLQLDKNRSVSLTAPQKVTVTIAGVGQRTLVFKHWECDSRTFSTLNIVFTLSKDTVCTAMYAEGE